MIKKIGLILIGLALISCTAFEVKGRDGNIYRYEYCPKCWTEAWEDINAEMYEARLNQESECLEGKRMDCWGDPAGGGAGGGGGGADAGGGE